MPDLFVGTTVVTVRLITFMLITREKQTALGTVSLLFANGRSSQLVCFMPVET
jgi:hypothetical protein